MKKRGRRIGHITISSNKKENRYPLVEELGRKSVGYANVYNIVKETIMCYSDMVTPEAAPLFSICRL